MPLGWYLESILLGLLYRTLEIIIERATNIFIFFIYGYVRNLYQKGGQKMGRARWVGDSNIIHKFIGTCF